MDQSPDQDRQARLEMVANGLLKPDDAERWARRKGQNGFAINPHLHDPNRVNSVLSSLPGKWTLSMVAAWFVWRSPLAVFDQVDASREGWKMWVQTSPPVALGIGAKYQLEDVGRASFREILQEAYPKIEEARRGAKRSAGPLTNSAPSKSNSRRRALTVAWRHGQALAIDRLQKALLSGLLRAFNPTRGVPQLPNEWQIYFNQLASTADEIINSSLELNSYFLRHQVVEAESRMTARELDTPLLGVNAALGWVAYQRRTHFRALDKGDVSGRRYRGQTYPNCFESDRPVQDLFDAIVEGRLKGYRDGVEVALAECRRMRSLWQLNNVNVYRKDLLNVWPDLCDESAAAQILSKDTNKHSLPNNRQVGEKRGPKPYTFERIKKEMLDDLHAKRMTASELEKPKQDALASQYKASPVTVKKARAAALSEYLGVPNPNPNN
jgi:hypothetical protein